MGDPPVSAPTPTENDVLDQKIVKTDPVPALRIVHVCAAAEDRAVLKALVRQLTGVRVTHAGDIRAGGTMDVERRALLDAADVIVLLVSADFVASPEHKTDVVRALEQHAANAAQLVPVLCRPCTWDGLPYAGLLALPRDKQPIVVERKVREDAHEGAPSTVIEQQLREDALAEVAREIRTLVAEPTESDAACPFPGLEFFDEDRAADFFGREAQITEALAQLSESRPARRWLQIDGPSGAGKSSFGRAGIVPAVRAGKLRMGPKAWITVVMRPGYDPITSLAEALVKHAKPPLDVKGSLDAVTRELSSSTTAFKSFLREHAPEGSGVLLVVDQLEETFTLAHADEGRVKQFDALVATALDDREGPLILVTTIRSDFVARMGELPALEGKLPTQAVRYYLRPMDEADLRSAIEKPAERAGLAYEEGLVDRIVADASTSRGALPLVAHVLEALYVRREGLRLTARAYDLVGGVGGALAKSADAIIDSLEVEDQARAQRLLLRLVKIGRGSEDTRQTATRVVALGAAGGDSEAERVLARLSGGRALGLGGTSSTAGRLVVVSGEPAKERVDLVHEALLQRWERLRAWIKDAREELELRDDVEEAARIWEASGKPKGGLPKGVALARFRSVDLAGLKDVARTFLTASEDAVKRVTEQRRRRELEKLKASDDRTRLQKRVIIGLVGFAIALAVAAGAFAWQKKRADDAATTAEARRLAAQAGVAGVQHRTQQQILLALEALKSSRSPAVPLTELTQALGDAVWGTEYLSLVGHLSSVMTATFSPDGTRIVTASLDHTARVWNSNGVGEPVVLRGHEASVYSAAFSPDGSRVVTASADNTARVWTIDGTSAPIILRGHSGEVKSAIFSPDGRRVVTASADDTARVWSADGTGGFVILRGHRDRVNSAVFSPDGARVITASSDGTARIWTPNDSNDPIVLRGDSWTISTALFSPDGRRVLVASDKVARVWDSTGAGEPVVLRGHEKTINWAAFSPDSTHLLTASEDKTVRVWSVDGTGQPIVLRGHEGGVWSAAFSPDSKRVAAASWDNTVEVWTADGNGLPIVLRGHDDEVNSVAFTPDGRHIVTASRDNTARVWSAEGTQEPVTLRGHNKGIASAALSPDGKRVITASGDRTARIWNADGSGDPIILNGHLDQVQSALFSPDGKRVVTASHDMTARVWNADGSGEPIVLRGHADWVWGASFSPDCKRVVTASKDRTARVWNADGTGTPIVLRGHEAPVRSAVFSPDGTRVVTASWDQTARVWKADGTSEPLVLRGHEATVRSAAFSPDGRLIVTASEDRTARVWRADGTGEPLVLSRHADSVLSAAFSPDGMRIVTTSEDRTARVWSANGVGEPVVLRGHEAAVDSAAFSPDGAYILTTSQDRTARIWNADGTGEPMILRGHEDAVECAAFSPDGKRVLTASWGDWTARVWTIDPRLLTEIACARVQRNFTRDEWRHFWGDVPYRRTCDRWPAAPDADPVREH